MGINVVTYPTLRNSGGSVNVKLTRDVIVGTNLTLVDNGGQSVTLTANSQTTAPGGSNGQLQYNSSSTFAGAGFSAVATSGILLSLTGANGDTPLAIIAGGTPTANLTEWQASGGTVGARITKNREFSNAIFTQSEQFGEAALVSSGKDASTAIGYNATCVGRYCVALGKDAVAGTSTFGQCTAIGAQAVATGNTGAIAIGAVATSTVADGIAIGLNAVANARGIAIGNSATLNGVQGFVAGLNAVQRNTGDLTWCWDAGAGSTSGFLLQGRSSTSTTRDMYRISTAWADSTDATRKSRATLNIYDTAVRECIRLEASGTEGMIGFYGVTAITRAVLATGASHTVDDVITVLQNLGLVKQS